MASWRKCIVCAKAVADHNDYFYHVKDNHPTTVLGEVVMNEFLLNRYINDVRAEYFMQPGREAQPWEWMTNEPVRFRELQMMFGDDSNVSKMYGDRTSTQ